VPDPLSLSPDEPLGVAVITAIRSGNVEELRRLLDRNPGLATGRIRRVCNNGTIEARSLLHVATDWPGNFPNVAKTVAALIAAGADVDAPFVGSHRETPLHWAASSDDVAAIDALLDGGADIERPGAVIAGGTPMSDAAAFGQWRAARRLLERGARTTLWEAATLGLIERVREHFAVSSRPSEIEITSAFWGACRGGQRDTAELLLDQGADLNWIGYDDLTPLDAARRSEAGDLVEWLQERGARSAQ
jgi:ankyrin repeat protein